MINVRFRNHTNTWPGFVDLFSNLVIILIFLLIVFVFLWTTTSVFNKNTGVRTVAQLRETNAAQAQKIQQMTNDEQEAKRLLILARNELENLESNNTELVAQIQQTNTSVNQMVSNYEERVSQLQAQVRLMQQMQQQVQEQINAQQAAQEQQIQENEQQMREMMAQRTELTEQMEKLQAALAEAISKSQNQEVQYVEMSNRLNQALADKVAELNDMAQYQSEFYRTIKNALGDRTTIRQDGDRFIVSSDILFSSGSYTLSADGKNQLRLISNVIKDMENKIPTDIDWIIRVDGHTDIKPVRAGTRGYRNNTELSLRRATTVVDELVKNGVSKRRLVPSGFGETHPVELGNDAASLQKNRRIELQLTNK